MRNESCTILGSPAEVILPKVEPPATLPPGALKCGLFSRSKKSPRVFTERQEARQRPVAFLFSGQGTQYPNMSRGLYETEPVFREQVDRRRIRAAFAQYLSPTLVERLAQSSKRLVLGGEDHARHGGTYRFL